MRTLLLLLIGSEEKVWRVESLTSFHSLSDKTRRESIEIVSCSSSKRERKREIDIRESTTTQRGQRKRVKGERGGEKQRKQKEGKEGELRRRVESSGEHELYETRRVKQSKDEKRRELEPFHWFGGEES